MPSNARRQGGRGWWASTGGKAGARLPGVPRPSTMPPPGVSIYRDPEGALAVQIAAKRAVVAEHAKRMSPVLRALAAEATRARLRDTTTLAAPLPTGVGPLTELDAELEALLAAYEETFAREMHLRRCPHEAPRFAKPAIPPPWLIEEQPTLRFREELSARLERIAPGTTLLRWGDYAYLARFTVDRHPLELLLRARTDPTLDNFARLDAALRSSLPEGMPPLEVRPERMTDAIGKILGVSRDISAADPPFDEAYFLTGDQDAVAALTPDVHAALLEIRPRTPTLTLGPGLVELTWTGAWRQGAVVALPDAALEIVCGVRRAVEG